METRAAKRKRENTSKILSIHEPSIGKLNDATKEVNRLTVSSYSYNGASQTDKKDNTEGKASKQNRKSNKDMAVHVPSEKKVNWNVEVVVQRIEIRKFQCNANETSAPQLKAKDIRCSKLSQDKTNTKRVEFNVAPRKSKRLATLLQSKMVDDQTNEKESNKKSSKQNKTVAIQSPKSNNDGNMASKKRKRSPEPSKYPQDCTLDDASIQSNRLASESDSGQKVNLALTFFYLLLKAFVFFH